MMVNVIKKVMVVFWVFLLTSMTCWGDSPIPPEKVIIADHNAVNNFDKIPDEYLNKVKQMLVVVTGESHCESYLYGFKLLGAMNDKYKVVIKTEPGRTADDPLVVSRYFRLDGKPKHWGGEEYFWSNRDAINNIKNFLTYQREMGQPLTAFGFGWCYDMTQDNVPIEGGLVDPVWGVQWAGSSVGGPDGNKRWGIDDEDYSLTGNRVNLQTYLNAIDEYNAHERGTRTFFSTGPVDKDVLRNCENGYQRYLKHQEIRRYVREHGGVLFDYADILCWDENNVEHMEKWTNAFGKEVFFQNGVPALAPGGVQYGSIGGVHDANNDGFDDDYGISLVGNCHISREGCIRIGKAMWWMLARIAGWEPEVITVDITSATTIKISFNEPIEETTATDINNYIISDPVKVVQAVLDPSGTLVNLTTSEHTSGTYSITIANIKNKAGNVINTAIKSYNYDDGGTNDNTPPSDVIQVNDGLGTDISFTNSTTSLSSNWSVSNDPESGIAKYYYAVGTSPGGTDLLNWTDNGKELTVTVTELTLIEGRTYYISVKAENGKGLQSNWTSSNGQTIDSLAPLISAAQAVNITSSGADITWETNELVTGKVEYGLTTEYGSEIALGQALAVKHMVGLTGLTPGTTYCYRVAVTDQAGNISYSENNSFVTLSNPTPDLSTGLVGHWKFDGDITDYSVNHYNGVLKEPAQWVDGHLGSGILLNNNYINLGFVDFGLKNELTISAWIMTNGNTGAEQIIIRRGQYMYPFALFLDRATTSWPIKGGIRTPGGTQYATTYTPRILIKAKEWHHVVMTYQSGALVIYLDGVEVIRNSIPVGDLGLGTTTSETYIGAGPGGTVGGFFNGVLDELRIYNRSLSADEILELYNYNSSNI